MTAPIPSAPFAAAPSQPNARRAPASSGNGGRTFVDPYARGASTRAAEAVAGRPGPVLFPGTEAVDPREVFAGPGYTSPKSVENGKATAALWLAVVGVVIPLVLPVSLLVGLLGLVDSTRLYGRVGRHESQAALAVSGVVLGLWAMLVSVLVNA